MFTFIVLYLIIQIGVCDYDRRIITSLKYTKYKHNKVAPTIVHGQPAQPVQVPYLVSLKQPDSNVFNEGWTIWRNLCGGTIISIYKILTAAHCFEPNAFYFARNPQTLRYVAGNVSNTLMHTGMSETTPLGQWRKVMKVIIHNKFLFPLNDIAIAFIDVPWLFNENVHPINMATQETDYEEQCIAAGYGRVGPTLRDTISPILLVAPIKVLPRMQCSSSWEMDMNTFICTDTQVTDVARGDSGGPLVCNSTDDPAETTDDGILVGIVSGKNVDKTSLFTRISAYRSWINNNEASQLVVSPCLPIILLIAIYFWFYFVFVDYPF